MTTTRSLPRRFSAALALFALVVIPASGNDFVTYLGGKFGDSAYAVAADAAGDSYVAGATHSPDFPDAPGFTTGNRDTNTIAFVAKISSAGRLLWRALIAGQDGDSAARAIAIEPGGSVVIAGSTMNPSTFPFSGSTRGSGFVARLSADGLTLVKVAGVSASPQAIALDPSGAVYVAGSAGPDLLTTPGAYQPRLKPGDCSYGISRRQCSDAFVMKLSPDLEVVYATYLGGSDDDAANGIAVDSSGSAWVAGNTASADFPVSTPARFGGPAPSSPVHYADGFAARLSPDGRNLRFATFLGGPEVDVASAVALDESSGVAWVAGQLPGSGVARVDGDGSATYSSAVPRGATGIAVRTRGAIYVAKGGLTENSGVFVLDPATGNLLHHRPTLADVVAVAPSGAAHIAGTAYKLACVTTPGAMQPSYRGGDSDAFVGQIAVDRDGPVTPCITNAATFRPGLHPQFPAGEVAPGEVVSIFGAFGAGTRVSFDDIAAPVLYSSAEQINVVVPFEIAGPVTRVTIGDTGPIELPVLPAVPGIFVVLNEDFTVNSGSNPARRDARIILYATGVGRMDPPMASGSVAGAAVPLPRPALGAAVRFGTLDAALEYAGAAPGLIAGVIQVNVKLPGFAPNFRVTSLPATLSIGDYSSSPISVWIAP